VGAKPKSGCKKAKEGEVLQGIWIRLLTMGPPPTPTLAQLGKSWLSLRVLRDFRERGNKSKKFAAGGRERGEG